MFGEVVLTFGLIAISSATIYESVYKAGLSYFSPEDEMQLEIPSGQCTGRITLEELGCIAREGYFISPDVLEVNVGDNSGITKIEISDLLDRVDIVRKGDCYGVVVITLKKHCPIAGKRNDKREVKRAVIPDLIQAPVPKPRRLRQVRPILDRAY